MAMCLYLSSPVFGAGWKDPVTGVTEDASIDGTEILYTENGAATANNWLALSTIKTWLETYFAAVLGADDNYVTDAEKSRIGDLEATDNVTFGNVTASGGTISAGVANTTQGALVLYTNTDPIYTAGWLPAATPSAIVSLRFPPAPAGGNNYLFNFDADGTGGWTDPATFAAALGADDNYVTDAEKAVIGNTSGTNTGDQVASGVTFTPNGTIAATNVQLAIQEVRDEAGSGGMVYPGVGIPISTGSAWDTSVALPTADNQIMQATGVGTFAWTSTLEGIIDDTKGNGDTTYIWSADKVFDQLALKAPLADPVFTGSLALPQGTAPTVNAAGEVAVDTSSGQLVLYTSAEYAISPLKQIDFVVKTPVDADDFFLFKAQVGMTITDIHVITIGGTSISVDIQECSSTGTTCATVDAAITADSDGATDDGTLSNPSIDVDDWVMVVLGAPTGTVNFLSGSIYYRETRN